MRPATKTLSAVRQQRGFTLIEIAIVLVIIGLLVGGVLQGQELLENSRVRQATRDLNGTATAMFAYQDRYGSVPGDDGPTNTLRARGSSWDHNNIGGDADGRLEANNNVTFNPSGESEVFWRQLKAAGFIAGDAGDTGIAALPTNSWGGLIGVTSQAVNGGLNGSKVCISQVPGSAAIAIDNEMDDGAGDTGRLRGTQGTSGVNTAPSGNALGGGGVYSEDNEYTLCYRM